MGGMYVGGVDPSQGSQSSSGPNAPQDGAQIMQNVQNSMAECKNSVMGQISSIQNEKIAYVASSNRPALEKAQQNEQFLEGADNMLGVSSYYSNVCDTTGVNNIEQQEQTADNAINAKYDTISAAATKGLSQIEDTINGCSFDLMTSAQANQIQDELTSFAGNIGNELESNAHQENDSTSASAMSQSIEQQTAHTLNAIEGIIGSSGGQSSPITQF